MKNLIIILTSMTFAILLTSCIKNEDSNLPISDVYPNYSKFKVGSYWVYRRYNIDAAGNATTTNIFDSCFVEKDTVINDYTYTKVHRPDPYPNPYYNTDHIFVRDSLHYIVAYGGQIQFSSKDFQTIFKSRYQIIPPDNDTICKISMKMADKDSAIYTPAGKFITSSFQTIYNMFPKFSVYGISVRKMNTRYTENIGIVTETLPISLGNPNYIERRLVRYHIQ